MKKYKFLFYILALTLSCNTPPDGHRSSSPGGSGEKVFKLQFNPRVGSTYKFNIVNQADTRLEIEGKELNNFNRTTVIVNYTVSRDSLGDYQLRMHYDNVKLYTKTDKQESELDADRASQTFDPVEKMLGLLKQSEIITTISPQGEMKSVTGYQELTDKVMAAFTDADYTTRSVVKSRWQQLIEEGVMKKSVDQLFNLFPDSAVKVGGKWTQQSTQKGEIYLNVTTTYTLEEITNGKAIIASENSLARDPSSKTVMGFEVTGNLDGQQTGKSEVDIKTGMLVKSSRIRLQ